MSEKLKITIKKYKWLIIILIIIFSIGCYHYIECKVEHNYERNKCKDKCCYMAEADCWKYLGTNKPRARTYYEEHSGIFKTQSQCIDYCLRHK